MIDDNNPPMMKVEFFKEQIIDNMNCFSNEGNEWDNSKSDFKRQYFKNKISESI